MIETCAICGGPIPFFSADASDADQELSAFDTLANGQPAHGRCLDEHPQPLIATMIQVDLFAREPARRAAA